MGWSEDDFNKLMAKRERKPAKKDEQPGGVKRWQALGRMPKGTMNKTEAAYAQRLELMKHTGEILDWKFHPMNIRLADRTFYEVDFLVMHADCSLAIHETKGGFTSEKGQLKIKLVAETLPWFRFFKCIKLPEKEGGGWKIEDYSRN